MGIKMIIAVACAVAGETTAQHAAVNDTVDVSKDDAYLLARGGRALYLERADDPTKGQFSATAEDLARIKREAKAIAAEREAKAAEQATATPAGMAAMVAAQVAAAVQAALKPAAPAA